MCYPTLSTLPAFTSSLSLRHIVPNVPYRKKHSRALYIASAKPLRVGIAGAGIAGLTTALTLRKTPNTGVQDIHVFEPRQDIDAAQGAAVNLNGATAILQGIYGMPVSDVAMPMNNVIAREPSGTVLFKVDVTRMVRQSAMASEELCVDGNHCFMTVMRDDLQSLLLKELGDDIVLHRGESNRVVDVHQQGNQACFVLKDGSKSEPFDLVIGADGVRSNVRDYVVGMKEQPMYSGIRVQWAIAPGSDLPFGTVEQWFGEGAYVLRYAAGSENERYEMLACSFREGKTVEENAGYEQNTSLRDDFSLRLERSSMPQVVQKVLARSERLIETAVYRHALPPKWYRGSTCLVGDSAHAMPPYLGQGANQAVQDAHCLALALSQIGEQYSTLSEALEKYESIRRVPVQAILQTSRLAALLEIQDGSIQSRMRNSFFRVLGAAGIPQRTLLQASRPRYL